MILATAVIIRHFPTRRLFLFSMTIFTIGIFLSAIAPVYSIMLLGRIVQGIGYGIIIALTQVVILTTVPAGKQGFAMGIYGLAVVFAPILGTIAAGIVIDHASWRWVFWIILGICIVNLILALRYMQDVLDTSPQTFDIPSMVIAAIGFTGIVLGAGNIGSDPFFSPRVGLLFLAGILALVFFGLRQRKLTHPLLQLRIFHIRSFAVAVIISMILYGLMNAMSTIMPILVQTVMGKGAAMFGIVIAPCAIFMALLSPVTGRMYDKIGMKPMAITGCILILVSKAGVLFIHKDAPLVILMILVAILGIGLSGIMMNIVTYGMSDLSNSQKTDGTALLSCLRTMGSAIGTAVFVSIMSFGVRQGHYTMANIHHAYLGMTILATVPLILTLLLIRTSHPAMVSKSPQKEEKTSKQ